MIDINGEEMTPEQVREHGSERWFRDYTVSDRGIVVFGDGCDLLGQWVNTDPDYDAQLSFVLAGWVEDHFDELVAFGNHPPDLDDVLRMLRAYAADPDRMKPPPSVHVLYTEPD